MENLDWIRISILAKTMGFNVLSYSLQRKLMSGSQKRENRSSFDF
jgi:hypothetical protein